MAYRHFNGHAPISLVVLFFFLLAVNALFTPLMNSSDTGSKDDTADAVFDERLTTGHEDGPSHTVPTITREDFGAIEPAVPAEPTNEMVAKNNAIPLGRYRVQRGDTLYWIAETYDTTVSKLKELNNLTTTSIRPSEVLTVPLHTQKEYPVGIRLTNGEVRWLAQMIHAEARGEPYLGQVGVGAVVINRMKSPQFPNSMRDVLFQPKAFQPIANGSFYRPANDMAYRAALEALNGHDPTQGSLFFFNPRQSDDRFMHARPTVVTIGQHRFMR